MTFATAGTGNPLVMNAAPAGSSLGERATVLVGEARSTASTANRANADHLARAVVGELRRGGDAGGLQEAIAERLSPQERGRFAEEVGRRVERHTAANARLTEGARGLSAASPRQARAEAEQIIETATDVRYENNINYSPFGGGSIPKGTRTEVLSENELSFQLEELAKRDPALAAGVKAHLDTVLTDRQGSRLDRLLAGNIRVGENVDLAFRHPKQGIEGGAKKVANVAMAIDEMRLGDQNHPRFVLDNRAQAGGATVAEAASYAGGAGAVRGGGMVAINGVRHLAASQTVRLGAATSGTLGYGTAVNMQTVEGTPLLEAMMSEQSLKTLATTTVSGALAGQKLPAREVAVGAAAVAGFVELSADDIAGRDLDLGNAALAATNNGVMTSGGVALGDVLEMGVVGARASATSIGELLIEGGRTASSATATVLGETHPPLAAVSDGQKTEGQE